MFRPLLVVLLAATTAFATAQANADTTPPVSSASFSAAEVVPGWYGEAVTITLTASDNESGVNIIRYKLDDVAFRLYYRPLQVTTEGPHVLEFYAIDKARNAETVHRIEFSLDLSAPELDVDTVDGRPATPVVPATGGGTITDRVLDVVGEASDGAGIGIAKVELFEGTVASVALADAVSNGGPFTLEWNHHFEATGLHKLIVRATDGIGRETDYEFFALKTTEHFG